MLSHRLAHRIAFQEPVEAQDATTGEVTVTWTTPTVSGIDDMSNVPAEVLTGPGREFLQSGATQGETAARINIRWFPGLSEKWRITWDGRTYNVGSFSTDRTGRREWRIVCTEGVNEG